MELVGSYIERDSCLICNQMFHVGDTVKFRLVSGRDYKGVIFRFDDGRIYIKDVYRARIGLYISLIVEINLI